MQCLIFIKPLNVKDNIEIENRMLVLGVGGEDNGELVFNGYRILVWDDEKVLEMDRSDVSCECI